MRLSSVLALKEQLLQSPTRLVENAALSRPFEAFAAKHAVADRARSRIALGVAPQKRNEFRLAVRPQRSGPLVSAMVEEIVREAHGEADVRFIGNIVKFARATNRTRPAFFRARRRPLIIGSSISDVHDDFISAGTLGCFVVGRRSRILGMLTNNHVIANENGNSTGDPVVQQGTLDGGDLRTDQWQICPSEGDGHQFD